MSPGRLPHAGTGTDWQQLAEGDRNAAIPSIAFPRCLSFS